MHRRALVSSVGVFAAALLVAALVVAHLERLDREGRRGAAAELARASALAIEQEFSRSLTAVSALGAMVTAGASGPQLEAVAVSLLEVDGGTASLQLARAGVISHVWPLRGNEAAMG